MEQGIKIKVDPTKETEAQRKERLELIGAVKTRIVPDKTKYKRKAKHKNQEIICTR